jgi:hypothetical protein
MPPSKVFAQGQVVSLEIARLSLETLLRDQGRTATPRFIDRPSFLREVFQTCRSTMAHKNALGQAADPEIAGSAGAEVKPDGTPETAFRRNLRGCGLAMGIFVCLMTYGYVQERIMTSTWDGIGGAQISSLFLVMCNRVVSLMVAVTAILINRESFLPGAPFSSYLAISFSNMMATTCQYEALRYVSFPTQTLGKTAKMIPVMIWGALIGGKTYKAKDFIVAGSVTVGTTLFLLTGEITGMHAVSVPETHSPVN